jgi:hypothetical protein
VLATLGTPYHEAAMELDNVRLVDNDFPWLADVLLLAKAAAARRSGSEEERDHVSAFLAKQPLLFEPDHAFNFRLLEYQEILKTEYRARRTNA